MPASEKWIIPEVVPPDEPLPPDLLVLRRFATIMDELIAVPGTRFRFGVDAALGLIPGVGDAVAALLSTWIVIGALRHRVPTRKVFRMIFNILLDLGLGSVPVIGDIFDFLFEENVMNLDLLLRHRDRSRPPRSFASVAGAAFAIIGVVLLFSLCMLTGVVIAVIWLIRNR
jgi:hypothetical protein